MKIKLKRYINKSAIADYILKAALLLVFPGIREKHLNTKNILCCRTYHKSN